MRKRLNVWLTDVRICHVVGTVSHVAVGYTLQLVDVESIGCSFTELDFNGVRPLTTTVVVFVIKFFVSRHTHSPRDRSWVVSCNIHRIGQQGRI